jgi:calcineurin-like phosphoesterase family protein
VKPQPVKYWVITDTHFNHANLIKLGHRPADFEQQIIVSLSVIQAEDVLIHLGDVAMGQAGEGHTRFLTALPKETRKILVIGNHDAKSNSWFLRQGWTWACKRFSGKYFGRKVKFSHEPSQVHYPYVNIHGHTHGNGHRGELLKGSIEVALEKTGYRPLLLEELLNKNEPYEEDFCI